MKKSINNILFCSILTGTLAAPLFAFEDTQVLPKGVRSVTIKTFNTTATDISDNNGIAKPIASPLNKALTFSEVLKNEDSIRKLRARGFLLNEGFEETDVVGQIHAEMKADISVFAPIIAYGLTDRLTLAVVVPYVKADVKTSFGFTPNENAQLFLNALARPENNQIPEAQRAGLKLNDVYGELNNTLALHGYQALQDWQNEGIADITLANKYLAYNGDFFKSSITSGVVLPTGSTDNPDILNDIPFGDGSYDAFAGLTLEQHLGHSFILNQHSKYTYQFPTYGEFRLQTKEEEFEVEKERIAVKYGDKIESGVSIRSEWKFGLISGIEYLYTKKLGDDYHLENGLVETELERHTDPYSFHTVTRIGYSSIEAFKAKKVPVPLVATIEYKKLLESQHTPIGDLVTFDFSLFF